MQRNLWRCLVVVPFLFLFWIELCGFALETSQGRALFPPQLKDGVFPHHYRPERTVDFEHLRLEIQVFMKEKRIEGTAHYRLRPIHDGVTQIRLDAYEMQIHSVTVSDSTVEWRYSDNSLYLTFPEPLPCGQSISMRIGYASNSPYIGGKYGAGMHFTDSRHVAPEQPDQVFTIVEPFGASVWFPCGDYPNDLLQTELVVTVPKPYVTLSNGLCIASTEDGGWRTDHWRQERPHATYLVSLAIGDFEIVRDEWRGIPVEYYVERGLGSDARPSLGKTPAMIEFFSEYLQTPYPYEKYAQVAVRYFTAGGMEHTTATTMHQWIVLDESARLDSDEESLIMHELAHQWFGDMVTCKNWAELWLNEGFATLSDALWDEHSKGPDAYLEAILNKMEGYIGDSRRYTRAIVTNVFEKADEMFDGHSYPKGAAVLHMLRQELGDAFFRKALHRYLDTHAPGLVDTDDLMESIEATTGRPMDRFFEQWVYRPGHPRLKVTHEWLPEKKQVKFTILQTQEMKEGEPAFAFPLDLEVCTQGQTYLQTIQVQRKEETAFVDCPEAPQSVRVDPCLKVLKELEHPKSQDMLLEDLRNGSTIIVRIQAARALAEHRKPEVEDALFQAIQSDPYLRVRTEALQTLAKERTDKTRDRIVQCLDDPDAKIRRAAVNALHGFYKDAVVIASLEKRIEADPSTNVVADAIQALGQIQATACRELIRNQLQRESWKNRIRVEALDALVKLKHPSAFTDFVTYSHDPYPRDVRTTAIAGLGRLAAEMEKEPGEALEILLQYLQSQAVSIRQAAIEGLEALGNRGAVEPLRWVETNDGEERVRYAAGRAIAAIYRDRESELAGKNAGQIDVLKDETIKLEDRVKELEEKLKSLLEKENLEAKGDLDS